MKECVINICKNVIQNYNNDIIFQLFDEEGEIIECSENVGQDDKFKRGQMLSWGNNKNSLFYLIQNDANQYIKETNDYIDISYKINENNEFHGYLNLVGKKNINVKEVGNLIFELIKTRIKYRQLKHEWKVKDEYNNAIIRSLSDGFLVLNKQERVTHINDKAVKILNTSRENILNEKLQNFVKSELQVLEVLRTGKSIRNKELIVKLNNGEKIHVLKNAVPVRDEQNEVIAVIDHFKKIKKVRQFVSDMVGSNATFTFEDIIHDHSSMTKIIKFAKKVAKTSPTILIQGESGTGKELFAHAIHNYSYRQNNPFVIVDCASLPRELVESELFGYVEGAFTGAKRGGRPGKFELANGGTIFLDEIGEMPLELQSKLLRVLQNRMITRIGGSESIDIDVKVIAATNRDLEQEVNNDNFREDLFYRLNVVRLTIPPLKKRWQDIPVLIKEILNKVKRKFDLENVEITEEVQKLFCEYSWPGNVRELENVLFSSINRCDNGIIDKKSLPDKIKNVNTVERIIKPEPCTNKMEENKETIEYESLKEMEYKYIMKVLKAHNGNKKETAEKLDISRSTLYRKLNRTECVSK